MESRNDLLNLISEYAASYTPEWKFDVSNPDATSVIGIIYANQMLDNVKKLNRLLTKYHIEFANMYGVSLKSATPAKTICIFDISENIFSGSELKKGTQVIGTNDMGDEIIFVLCHDVNITAAKLTDIVSISGNGKFLRKYGKYDRISLFDYSEGNSYKQLIEIDFNKLPQLGGSSLFFKFSGDVSSKVLAGIFGDKSTYKFKYICQGEEYDFDDVVTDGEFIELKADIEDSNQLTVILEQEKPVHENFMLDNIELFIKGDNEKPSFMWNGNNEIIDIVFTPFSNQPTLYNEFYIGDSFVFEQYGAKAVLHFKLEFDRYQEKDTAQYEEDLRIIKRKSKASYGKAHYRSYVQEISFDYFNGKGWKHLETDSEVKGIFSNEDNANEYEIRFNIPSDWESVVIGGYEGNCIRIQVIKSDNCYMNGVEYCYPILSDVILQMDNQIRGIQPSKLTYVHGDVVENDISKAFHSMEYDGDYIYWGFDKKFVHGPIGIFADVEKSNSYKGIELEFSYSSAKGFKPLKVIDDTEMFQNSGIIMFMPPADMNELAVEGNRKYWIRIEDRTGYFKRTRCTPPRINNIYVNAAHVQNTIEGEELDYYIDTVTSNMRFPLYSQNILSADIWVNEKEQLSIDEMNRMANSEAYDTRIVYNFLGEIEEFYVLWHEVENFDEISNDKRVYNIDRNRNEVIFGDGVTTYVPQNTSSVAFKAKVFWCDGENANLSPYSIDRFRSSIISIEDVTNPIGAFGGTDMEDISDALIRGSNILSSRKRLVSKKDYLMEAYLFSDTIVQVACITDTGISLVLLMGDFKKGDYSFRNIQGRLKEHLLNKCEITCGANDIHIMEPVFVGISIDLWITIDDMTNSLEIKQRWINSITNYLEPIKTDHSQGWQIGFLPTSKQIRLMLSTLEGTAYIENINIIASYTLNGICYEIGLDQIEQNPYMICCNGNHNIYINGI